jgi:hypothetical protein
MPVDHEIREIELRLAHRRHLLERTARAAKDRAARTLFSPVGLLGAAGVGLLAVLGVLRKRSEPKYRYSHRRPSKLAGLAGLAGSVALALLRAQFGSPAQMAQVVLARLKKPPGQPAHGRP